MRGGLNNLCQHCRSRVANCSRGLCAICYLDPSVRYRYGRGRLTSSGDRTWHVVGTMISGEQTIYFTFCPGGGLRRESPREKAEQRAAALAAAQPEGVATISVEPDQGDPVVMYDLLTGDVYRTCAAVEV